MFNNTLSIINCQFKDLVFNRIRNGNRCIFIFSNGNPISDKLRDLKGP